MKNPFKLTSPRLFSVSLTVLIVALLQLRYVNDYYVNAPVMSRAFDFGPGILMMFGMAQAAVALVGIALSVKRKAHK